MKTRSQRSATGRVGWPPIKLTDFHSGRYIGGLTHGFYRYPAATSPELVRELLLTHTSADDLLLDPFMGGGTTIVEAVAHGRRAIGGDLNSLALFVTRRKTTPLTTSEWNEVFAWVEDGPMRPGAARTIASQALGLPTTLRIPLERALAGANSLRTARQENLVRCALLQMGQWALESFYLYPRRAEDRRNLSPSLSQLRTKLRQSLAAMRTGMDEFVDLAGKHGICKGGISSRRILLRSGAEDLRPEGQLRLHRGKVGLVLTSPPYPNVHVLYHRWQIESRRETPAPYWIAGQSDGATLSYYIMGSRTPLGQRQYFKRLERAFLAVRPLLRQNALVLQVVAFNDSDQQLPRYLEAMDRAGYRSCHGRRGPPLVRDVPNRRWYARGNDLDAGREYLLIHTPRR